MKADKSSAEIWGNRFLCWIILLLLSLFPHNEASKLLDSLFCFVQYSPNDSKIVCSWSENLFSRKFMNISLVSKSYSCQKMEETKPSQSHVNRICYMYFHAGTTWTENINLTLQPNRSLESRFNITDRDEAKPQNPQCDVDGKRIKCYWKIRMEATESFDFRLFYNDTTGRETCQPSCHLDTPNFCCNCTITVKDHLSTSAVLNTIRVGPELENFTKLFIPCQNITIPTRNFTIKEEKKGEIFSVNLTNQEDQEIPFFKNHYTYEICYWRQSDLKSNEVSNGCPGQLKSLSKGHKKMVNFHLGHHLEANSNYALKVRVRLLHNSSRPCFHGPWSQWSEVKIMQTKSVPNIFYLYILIPLCVIFLVVCGLCGYKALLRYKNQWDDRIPNPSKSSIVRGFQKKKDWLVMRYLHLQNRSSLPVEEHLYVEPYNKILCTSSMSNDFSNMKHDQECGSRPDHEQILNEETQCFYFPNPTDNDYPTPTIADGYQPFSELTAEPERTDFDHSKLTFSAFDGPYLFSENG